MRFFFGMIISCSEMEKGLGSFTKKNLLIFVEKLKETEGKAFFDRVFYCFCKKSTKKVLAKDLCSNIFLISSKISLYSSSNLFLRGIVSSLGDDEHPLNISEARKG